MITQEGGGAESHQKLGLQKVQSELSNEVPLQRGTPLTRQTREAKSPYLEVTVIDDLLETFDSKLDSLFHIYGIESPLTHQSIDKVEKKVHEILSTKSNQLTTQQSAKAEGILDQIKDWKAKQDQLKASRVAELQNTLQQYKDKLLSMTEEELKKVKDEVIHLRNERIQYLKHQLSQSSEDLMKGKHLHKNELQWLREYPATLKQLQSDIETQIGYLEKQLQGFRNQGTSQVAKSDISQVHEIERELHMLMASRAEISELGRMSPIDEDPEEKAYFDQMKNQKKEEKLPADQRSVEQNQQLVQ